MNMTDDELEFEQQLEALLASSQYRDNPLLPWVERLFDENREQRKRLDKLMRIADGYGSVTRQENISLMERCDRHLRRLEKITRISDLYQKEMLQINENLRQAALHDALTGLPNRRHIVSRLKEMTAQSSRHEFGFSVALLDLDHFKSVNDRLGHEAGDRVLCAVAEVLGHSLRDYDLCGRWGGEEFLIVLPATGEAAALESVERIVENLRAISLPALDIGYDPQTLPPLTIGASAGISSLRAGEDFEQTIARADRALYRAKLDGRNCVRIDQ